MRPGPKRPRKRESRSPRMAALRGFNEAGAEKAPETG